MKALIGVFGGALAVASIGLGNDSNDASGLTGRAIGNDILVGAGPNRTVAAVSIEGLPIEGIDEADSSVVLIGAGIGPHQEAFDLGGNTPDIALFDVWGWRLGQISPDSSERVAPSTYKLYDVKENQGSTGQASYIFLAAVHNDGICLNVVSVTGYKKSFTWVGDVGYLCDMEWYHSYSIVGSVDYQPKCAWIDADHSNGLRYIGISMHLPDFNGSTGRISEYQEQWGLLCNSRGRFMPWGSFTVDPGQNTFPLIFTPPLNYYPNGADKDLSAVFSQGVVNESWPRVEGTNSGKYAINGVQHASSAPLPIYTDVSSKVKKRDAQRDAEEQARRDAEEQAQRDARKQAQNKTSSRNGWPGHVIISDYNAHRAAELCESERSRGPSFVSTRDGFYCDMDTKTLYPVCSTSETSHCFDLDKKRLITHPRHRARDVEARYVLKQYSSSKRWTPEK